MMRILAVLLSLLFTLPGNAMRMTLSVQKSEVLSQIALDGLNALLGDLSLTVSPDGFDAVLGQEPILWARIAGERAVLVSGDDACLSPVWSAGGSAWDASEALGELLSPWETEKKENADLKEAGTARVQKVYVLSGPEWAGLWPSVCGLLPDAIPEDVQIPGKATFKRYFDRDGREMGAYFYTDGLSLDGRTCEVRLEYGLTPGKGFLLTFRCTFADGNDGVRIALHGRQGEKGWTLDGDFRETSGNVSLTLTLTGKTWDRLTLKQTRKQAGQSAVKTVSLAVGDKEADWEYREGSSLVLSGTAAWETAELPSRPVPKKTGTDVLFYRKLGLRLLENIRTAAPDSWQQLIHFVSGNALIEAQKEDQP